MTLVMYTTLRVGSRRSTIAVVFSVLLALHKVPTVFIQFHVVCSTIRSGGDLHFLP